MAILCSDSIGVTEKNLWFVSHEGFFTKVNIQNGDTEVIELEPSAFKDFGNVIDSVLSVSGKLYFVNQHGTKLLQYDMQEDKCKVFDIPVSFKMINWGCFSSFVKYDKQIYMISKDLTMVLKFDTGLEEFSVDEKLIKSFSKYIQKGYLEDGVFSIVHDTKVYFVHKTICTLIVWDMKNNTVDGYNYEDIEGICIHADMDEEGIVLLTGIGNIYMIDIVSGKVMRTAKLPTKGEHEYGRIVSGNKYWFVFPALGHSIYRIDKKTGRFNQVTDVPIEYVRVYSAPKDWGKYYGLQKYGNVVWLANRMYNLSICVDVFNDVIKWNKAAHISRENMIKQAVMSNSKLREGNITLREFIK